MNKTLLLSSTMITAGIALGMGVQVFLRDDPSPASTHIVAATTPNPVAAEIATVVDLPNASETLQKEIAARQQLSQTVARLEKEIRELKTQVSSLSASQSPATSTTEAAAVKPEATHTNEPVFDDDALRTAGLSMAMVKQTRERFEQLEMDRLFLRDRAVREGWMGTVRYSNEVEKLEERRQDINNSLGDDGYDAYLYATNQSNRVIIREMLQGSPGKEAGLLPGDMVLRYGRKRIFSPGDLQKATTGGQTGESIAVEILRNNQSMTIYVPRGPLGVYLDADSAKPQ